MATQLDMWKDLRARIGTDDSADEQVAKVEKTRCLNQGIAAMFPRLYRVVRDTTLVLEDDTFEYELPSTLDGGRLIQVEVETEYASGRYRSMVPYQFSYHATSSILIFNQVYLPSEVGSIIRVTMAMPFTPFTESVTGAETYSGPTGTEELPVLYAMGIITSYPLDNRLDYNGYSTTHVLGNPQPVDLMTTSQFWFAQFELLLDRWSKPMPVHIG